VTEFPLRGLAPAAERKDLTVSCPCGTGKKYDECCGPIIAGTTPAATAEALMRSRYSAYAKGEIDYLLGSLHPDSSGDVDRQSTKAWSESAEWHGLEILSTTAGGENDETGEVEFVAKYSLRDEPQRHHERAKFKRHRGKWLYVDGDEVRAEPVVGPRVRVGRNDTCLCSSGQKFKKCCMPVFQSGASTPAALVRARFAAERAGEAQFLGRSLHPDAPTSEVSVAPEAAASLEIIECKESGDSAEVAVLLRVSPGQERRERHNLKKLKNRWLFVSAS
jgi:SEC-C motif domain protein